MEPNGLTCQAGVDLDVHPGEVVLIMGPSGSGKTTLLLMGWRDAAPHQRRHPGRRAGPGPRPRAAPAIAARPPVRFRLPGLQPAVGADRAGERGAGLQPRQRHRSRRSVAGPRAAGAGRARTPARLSARAAVGRREAAGGDRRALANDPPVILADEPTANLDSAIGRQVARLLCQLATQDRRAVVIVSHDTRLQEIADRVLWLEDGTFRELATMATDPVCGMTVPQHDRSHLQHDGQVWWFGSTACRDEFAADPDRFTHRPLARQPTSAAQRQ